MFAPEIENRARTLVALAREKERRLATAESCTGGLVAAAICGVAGASAMFERGIVAYSDSAKIQLLGVPGALISSHGAVSEEVARAMAVGAGGGLALSVTGVAGPGGGNPEKPVGSVWFGLVNRGRVRAELHHFGELGRHGVQKAALLKGLDMLLEALNA